MLHRSCLRGDMENRVKGLQWLFADRTSCHDWRKITVY